MREQLVRIILLCILALIVSSDLSDLLKSNTFTSLSGWMGRIHTNINNNNNNNNKKSIRNTKYNHPSTSKNNKWVKDKTVGGESYHEEDHNDLDKDDLRVEQSVETIGSAKPWHKPTLSNIGLTEEEKQHLIMLKSHWTKVMQQYCLPKLVCELHAAVTDGTSLSDTERGLLSLIKDTSLGTAGEIVSRYHFAAHMGQLLSGVEGNGCHNFYPNCPISGTRVLQMVKRVRV